jgi:hypothetical protein
VDYGEAFWRATNSGFAGTGLAALSGVEVPTSITESEHITKAGMNYHS